MIQPRLLISALAEKVEDYLKVHGSQYRRKEFEDVRDRFMWELARALAHDEKGLKEVASGDIEKIKQAMSSRYVDVIRDGSNYARMSQMYYTVDRERELLRDMRRTVDWATSWDHAKSFLFRTLTTIMIAGIVLGTAFLAKQWDIPLPLLRPLGM